MFRYFIYLAYDGTNYHGWQMQPNGVSVQETLVKALVTFLRDDAIGVTGAGRTDAGVHARLMVAHFDLEWMADPDLMADKLNRILPTSPYIRCAVSARMRMPASMPPTALISIMSPHGKIRSTGCMCGGYSSGWISGG